MDRFIDFVFDELGNNFSHLKSNMDRFIVCLMFRVKQQFINLKSNMDRFIVLLYSWGVWVTSI